VELNGPRDQEITWLGDISDGSVGQPAYAMNADGSAQILAPVVNFDINMEDSTGELLIINPGTGAQEGAAIDLTDIYRGAGSANEIFLPSVVSVYPTGPGDPGGAVIGGYALDFGINPAEFRLAFLPRNASTKRFDDSQDLTISGWNFWGGGGGGYVVPDTAAMVAMEIETNEPGIEGTLVPRVLFTNLTTGFNFDRVIFATEWDGNAFTQPAPVEDGVSSVVVVSTTDTEVVTALGKGPVFQDKGLDTISRYFLYCYWNEVDDGTPANNGEVRAAKVEVDVSGDVVMTEVANPLAYTNYECMSLDTDSEGNVLVTGALNTNIISRDHVYGVIYDNDAAHAIQTVPREVSGEYVKTMEAGTETIDYLMGTSYVRIDDKTSKLVIMDLGGQLGIRSVNNADVDGRWFVQFVTSSSDPGNFNDTDVDIHWEKPEFLIPGTDDVETNLGLPLSYHANANPCFGIADNMYGAFPMSRYRRTCADLRAGIEPCQVLEDSDVGGGLYRFCPMPDP